MARPERQPLPDTERVPTQVSAPAPMLTQGARRAAIETFLDRYRAALTGGDAPALADLWHVPALVVHDEGTRAVASHDEVEAFFRAAIDAYARAGVVDTAPEVVRADWLSPHLVQVTVRWRPLDAAGDVKGDDANGDEWVTYTLREGDEPHALEVCVAVTHGGPPPASVRGNA